MEAVTPVRVVVVLCRSRLDAVVWWEENKQKWPGAIMSAAWEEGQTAGLRVAEDMAVARTPAFANMAHREDVEEGLLYANGLAGPLVFACFDGVHYPCKSVYVKLVGKGGAYWTETTVDLAYGMRVAVAAKSAQVQAGGRPYLWAEGCTVTGTL